MRLAARAASTSSKTGGTTIAGIVSTAIRSRNRGVRRSGCEPHPSLRRDEHIEQVALHGGPVEPLARSHAAWRGSCGSAGRGKLGRPRASSATISPSSTAGSGPKPRVDRAVSSGYFAVMSLPLRARRRRRRRPRSRPRARRPTSPRPIAPQRDAAARAIPGVADVASMGRRSRADGSSGGYRSRSSEAAPRAGNPRRDAGRPASSGGSSSSPCRDGSTGLPVRLEVGPRHPSSSGGGASRLLARAARADERERARGRADRPARPSSVAMISSSRHFSRS